MSWLAKGRVTARHPEDHSVDLTMVRDGSRLAGVQVISYDASSDTGTTGLPAPATPTSGDIWSLTETTARDVIAVVGYLGPGLPVVMGFLFPQINGMTFKDGRYVHKHESGAYTTIGEDGSLEQYHPSGSFFRMGTGGHADMTGQDADGHFTAPNNAPAPTMTISVGTAGSEKASLVMSPVGLVTLTALLDVDVNTPQRVNLTAGVGVVMDAPDVSTTGNLRAGTGASGSFSTPTGQTVTVQDGIIVNIL